MRSATLMLVFLYEKCYVGACLSSVLVFGRRARPKNKGVVDWLKVRGAC